MKITATAIYKLTIPMEPFVIATETSYYAQNIFIRVHTDQGITGMGECSAFPMLCGETQNTCYEVGKDFARIIKGKNPLDIEARLNELNDYIAFNTTIKSAFDMALHDLAAKEKKLPLYQFLGGKPKTIKTDLTIGIDTPQRMAETAKKFIADGVDIIKIKLGKNAMEDVERVRLIREAAGPDTILRIDANQGWSYEDALYALTHIATYGVQYCEQPMRRWNDPLLPKLRKASPIKIMADESVFDHYDAIRLIEAGACDYINIKLAKSGGLLEAKKIAQEAGARQVPCMIGGMLESRLALTAKVHFARSQDNVIFYDLDTCLLGHKTDPVIGGARYHNYFLEISDQPGLDADIDEAFLKTLEQVVI